MKDKCPKHPKYNGNKRPKHQCRQCLALWMVRGGGKRIPTPPPTRVFKDKTKYSRKKKHKEDIS